jgi:hypothetical protein
METGDHRLVQISRREFVVQLDPSFKEGSQSIAAGYPLWSQNDAAGWNAASGRVLSMRASCNASGGRVPPFGRAGCGDNARQSVKFSGE